MDNIVRSFIEEINQDPKDVLGPAVDNEEEITDEDDTGRMKGYRINFIYPIALLLSPDVHLNGIRSVYLICDRFLAQIRFESCDFRVEYIG